ncbi:MAG: dienelactone hydrolase family protein [Saprospiraceae bacterium]|nr:dienelactone hydrolase family protein [Saprospiraceae bacterium]
MKNHLFYVLALALFFVSSCGNSSSEGDTAEQSDDMAQFAGDEKFKDAHDNPTKVEMQDGGAMITYDTPDGKKGSAFAIMPEGGTDKYLFVIHEWWGLNDNIKREAQKYADSLGNVAIMALDIYDGKSADNPDDAGKLMQSVKEERAKAIINGAIAYAGEDAEIATIGWCFGGGWSLKTSIMAGDQAAGCVMYYGMPVQDKEMLEPLQADVLGIFAEKDEWITPKVVNEFEKMATSMGKDVEVHQFEADHAFANPSQPSYVEEAATKANALALSFLREKL